jgi:hypothetical protein
MTTRSELSIRSSSKDIWIIQLHYDTKQRSKNERLEVKAIRLCQLISHVIKDSQWSFEFGYWVIDFYHHFQDFFQLYCDYQTCLRKEHRHIQQTDRWSYDLVYVSETLAFRWISEFNPTSALLWSEVNNIKPLDNRGLLIFLSALLNKTKG